MNYIIKNRKIKSMFLLLILNTFLAFSASASQYDHFVEKTGFSATQDVGSIMGSVIGGFLSLLSLIFIVLILYAGFNWMTASGDEQKVTKAKDTITKAVIGLVIIVAAYSITYFVFKTIPFGTGSSGTSGGTGSTGIFDSVSNWWNSWSFSDLFSGSDSTDSGSGEGSSGLSSDIYEI